MDFSKLDNAMILSVFLEVQAVCGPTKIWGLNS